MASWRMGQACLTGTGMTMLSSVARPMFMLTYSHKCWTLLCCLFLNVNSILKRTFLDRQLPPVRGRGSGSRSCGRCGRESRSGNVSKNLQASRRFYRLQGCKLAVDKLLKRVKQETEIQQLKIGCQIRIRIWAKSRIQVFVRLNA